MNIFITKYLAFLISEVFIDSKLNPRLIVQIVEELSFSTKKLVRITYRNSIGLIQLIKSQFN